MCVERSVCSSAVGMFHRYHKVTQNRYATTTAFCRRTQPDPETETETESKPESKPESEPGTQCDGNAVPTVWKRAHR